MAFSLDIGNSNARSLLAPSAIDGSFGQLRGSGTAFYACPRSGLHCFSLQLKLLTHFLATNTLLIML